MNKFWATVALCFVFAFLGLSQLKASHAMGADLTYEALGGNQYLVRLSFYRDCSGITPSSSYFISVTSATCSQSLGVTLNLLPGFPVEVSPLCAAQLPNSTCNGGSLPGVEQYVYEGIITLPMNCTDWVFSYREGNRNSTITTISNPGSAWLYVETTLDNVNAPNNSSPSFTTLPVPYICLGQPYVYNHGAVDIDGDSLVYSLINALDDAGVSVTYNGGFSGTNPMTSVPPVTINSSNGNLSITPNAIEIAVIAVRVDEYRNGVLISSTIRDIQVTVLNCSNNAPTVQPLVGLSGGTQTGPYSIEICPGTPLSFQVPGTDPDVGNTLTMTWNNGIPGATFTSTPGSSPVSGTFSWTPTGLDIGLNSLTISLEDNGCPVLGQQTIAIDILVLDGTYAGPDQAFCTPGLPPVLNATGGTVFNWNILSGSAGSLSCTNCASPTATPSVPTVYEVISNLPGACKQRDTVVVTPQTGFTVSGIPDITLCGGGGSTPLTVNPNSPGTYTYSWTPTASLSGPNTQSPTATPSTTTSYIATVTSSVGCVARDTVNVNISPNILNTAPTSTPPLACAGTPVTLDANVTTGSCATYTVANIPYSPLAGAGTILALGDDQVSTAIPLGFTFNFFCNDFTDIYVSSNGFVTFDPFSGSGCCSGSALPTGTIGNFIAGSWNDLYPPGGGTIRHFTVGTTPNRRFVVEFSGIPHCCSATPVNSFQIILFETSNLIEIHSTTITDDGSTHTQGIQGGFGPNFAVVTGRDGSNFIATNDAYRFSQIVPSPFTVTWTSPLGNPIGTGNSIVQSPGTTTTYYATVTDGVCVATDSVVVETANVNAGPDQLICPGDNTSLNALYAGPGSNCNVYTVSAIGYAPVAGAGTSLVLNDDELSAAIPMGFSFDFYCGTYTDIYISSNGFLTFDPASGSGCCSGQVLPDAFTPNNVIPVAWNDLYPPGNGTITYFTTGVAPNRRFVVNYTGIPYCCGATSDITAQAVLYETTNVIEFHNTAVTAPAFNPMTQGVEGPAGANGIAAPGRNGTLWGATNDAFRFSPQAITYSWSPPIYLSSTTVANPNANTVLTTTTYTITVNNGQCVMTDDVILDVNCLLPITALDLAAEKHGNQARLEWRTIGEEGIAELVLEESDHFGNWYVLSSQPAMGEPGREQVYTAWDGVLLAGVNTYRVRAVGIDGSIQYSNTAEVMMESPLSATVSPNPGTGKFTVEIQGLGSQPSEMKVYDFRGKIVAVKTLQGSDYLSIPLDLGNLADGIYLYEVRSGYEVVSGKIVKQQ